VPGGGLPWKLGNSPWIVRKLFLNKPDHLFLSLMRAGCRDPSDTARENCLLAEQTSLLKAFFFLYQQQKVYSCKLIFARKMKG
jgi:hypothetical protein